MAEPVNTGFDLAFGSPLWKFLAAAKAQGINARIISGARTDEDQRQLVANAAATRAGTALPYPERGRVPIAAPVGSSAHEFGLAADVQADNPADQQKLIALGQQFGLSHPMAYDPTHFEAPGWRDIAANQPPATPWDQLGDMPSQYASNISAGGAPPSTDGATPARPVTATPIAGGGGHADFIRAYAQKIGLDPNLALGIANAEGLRAWSASNPNAASTVDVTNGKPWSFGDFQLNTRNGMGVDARKAGIDPSDPAQWQKADQFALDQMKSGGVGPWKGDPVAKAYLASGKVPALPAMPSTDTPGTTLASSAAPPSTLDRIGALSKDKDFLANVNKVTGQGAQAQDQGGGGQKPSPFVGAPPVLHNVSQMGGQMLQGGIPAQLQAAITGYQAPQIYGTGLTSMSAPSQIGGGPPGHNPWADAAGQPTGVQAPGTSINTMQQLQQMMAGGMSFERMQQMLQGGDPYAASYG